MNPLPRSVIFWALLILVLFGLWLLCYAAVLPPVPGDAKPHSRKPVVTQGAGALSLIKPAVVLPPPKTNFVIGWDWSADTNNPASNVVFNVRQCKTNRLARPSLAWPIIAVVSTNRCTVPIDKTAKMVWLSVTASNKVTGMESDFAR